MHDQRVVEAELRIQDGLATRHDLHDGGERGRRDLARIAERAGRLRVTKDRIVLPDGVGELEHATAVDREGDLLILLALERLIHRHALTPPAARR